MTAQAKKRPIREERWKHRLFTLASGKIAYQNAAAFLNRATGKVEPAALGTNFVFVGTFDEDVDASAGDLPVNVDLREEVVITYFANGTAGDAFAAASGNTRSLDFHKPAYALDDQTVSILATGKSLVGRVWDVDSAKGVGIEKVSLTGALAGNPALPAFVANASSPTDVTNGAFYDVLTTGAASTIVLPAATPDGTRAYFLADGTKNGHTVQYVDATGSVNLTTALTASKRHFVEVAKLGGKWFANAYVSP